jgi:hypothetical protein
MNLSKLYLKSTPLYEVDRSFPIKLNQMLTRWGWRLKEGWVKMLLVIKIS